MCRPNGSLLPIRLVRAMLSQRHFCTESSRGGHRDVSATSPTGLEHLLPAVPEPYPIGIPKSWSNALPASAGPVSPHFLSGRRSRSESPYLRPSKLREHPLLSVSSRD